MTTLTNDQIENIQEQIIQLSDKYLGKTLEDPNTLPLIEEVRNALQTEYPDVKVNKKKFSTKVHTLNSIYKLKFKAKENSELFKKFM